MYMAHCRYFVYVYMTLKPFSDLHLFSSNRGTSFALKDLTSTEMMVSIVCSRKSSLIGRNSNLRKSDAAIRSKLTFASDSPTHTRGPIENGMNLYGWYWNLPLASIQRSGLNVSGSEKLAGSRCTLGMWIMTVVSFGTSKRPENHKRAETQICDFSSNRTYACVACCSVWQSNRCHRIQSQCFVQNRVRVHQLILGFQAHFTMFA